MKLYLIRHAIAADINFTTIKSDSERPLTEDGIKKFKKTCEHINKCGITFDAIWSSPYLRAKQTADILAHTLKLKNNLDTKDFLKCGCRTEQLVLELNKHSFQSLAIVGHEPDLSNHVSQFISGTNRCLIEFKKGGLARIDFEHEPDIGNGILQSLIPPKWSAN